MAGFGEGDEFVIGGSVDARFDWEFAFTITDMKIGRWLAGEQIMGDADGVIGAGGDALVGIGAKAEGLGGAVAGPVEFDGEKGGVFDVDEAAFGGGFEEEAAVFIAFEDGGEQADHGFTGDRGAAVEPGAVAFDDEGQIAAIGLDARRGDWGGIRASGGNIRRTNFRSEGVPRSVVHNLAFP